MAKDEVAFSVSRNVWTRMQLGTLETFLDVRVEGANEPIRSRPGVWIPIVFALGLDALFLAAGGSCLLDAYRADGAALSYQNAGKAKAVCPESGPPSKPCFSYWSFTVEAIGAPTANYYPVQLAVGSDSDVATLWVDQAGRDKVRVGMPTFVEEWGGHLTLLQIDDKHWVRTSTNPFTKQQLARTGRTLLIVSFSGFIPLIRRVLSIVS
jgi:hypothetical protein